MLLRPFGAMNGLLGGGVIAATGFGTAVVPSNGVTEPPSGSPGIDTTGRPAVWAPAGSAHPTVATSAAATRINVPQAPWRIRSRAYARLRRGWRRGPSS